MMYTQKQSYFLVREGYRLSSKKYVVSSVKRNSVQISIQHIWRSHGKRRRIFTQKLGWYACPNSFFIMKEEMVLSNSYFQTDDREYKIQTRVFNHKRFQELLNLHNLKID